MGAVDTCVSFWREFWVAGARFYPEGIAALGADPVGKPLKLVPEPENPHDPNAVAVVVPTARGDGKVGYIPRTFAREMRAVLSELERIADAVDVRCEVISCEESGPYVNLNGRLIVEVPESPEQALAADSLARRVASALYPEDGWHEEELPWSFEAVVELAGSENLLIALLMSEELGTPLLARDPDITRRLMAAGKAVPAAVARRRGAPVKGWPDVEVFYGDPADLQRLAASCRALTDAGEHFSREECSALLTETLRILCDTDGSADFKRERYGIDRVTFLREKHAEWTELLGSASAIVEVVRAGGYAAKNGNVAELLPEKAVFWASDALKSAAVRCALPWVFLCAFAPRLGKGFGAFTWEGLAPEEYAFAAELLANAHPRGLKALLRHAAEADAEAGACGLLQAPAALAWEENDIV